MAAQEWRCGPRFRHNDRDTEDTARLAATKTKPKHGVTEVTEITEKVWKKSSRRAEETAD
jgi:hypothetical protein